jgi:uncharacterized membrane protein
VEITMVRRWFVAFAIAVATFAVVDLAWIGLVATPLYRSELGTLLADQFNLPVAGVFYLGFVALLVHFGVQPHDRTASLGRRIGSGALYGLATYGTWALTGYAVLRGFSAVVAVTDIAWGVAVCAIVTAVTSAVVMRGQPRAAESA